MITTESLTKALERRLADTPHFLVFAEVRPTGKAIVEVDNDKAITMDDLSAINQGLREEFGDALDDLELEVSSPGMGRPFRVMRQYVKHSGRMVEVKLADGSAISGQLVRADDSAVHLRIEHPSKIKGRPAKIDEEVTAFPFEQVKSTQVTIKFN